MTRETMQHLNTQTLIGMTSSAAPPGTTAPRSRARRPTTTPGRSPSRMSNDGCSTGPPRAAGSLSRPNRRPGDDPSGPARSPARWVQVDDRQAIARSDTNAVLGIFGTGYVMHQYADWLLSTVANILDDDLVVSSAGLLRGGAIAWVEVSVPETITTPVGFDFRPNLLATTSFDGSISTTFKRTVTATVCDNTRDLALAEKGQHYKVKHTRYSSSKISAAREALAVVHTLADDFAKELAILANTPSANPSGGPSWTRTSPSTTARVTPSKAALGRWRPGSAASWRTSTGTTGGPLRGPAPPWVFFRRPTPGRTTTPPSAEPRGPSGTLPTPSTAPRPPTTGLPSRSSWPWSQPPDTIGPPGSSRSGGFGHFSPFIETAGHPLGMGVRWSALSRLAAAVMHTPRTPSSGSV